MVNDNKDNKYKQVEEEGKQLNQCKKEHLFILKSPIIVIPFNQENNLQSECWVINLDELKFFTCDDHNR